MLAYNKHLLFSMHGMNMKVIFWINLDSLSRVRPTRTYLSMKMEQTKCSERSAYKFQTPGIHPKKVYNLIFWNFELKFSEMFVVPNVVVFVVAWFHALPVCCSGFVWVILRWFQLPCYLMYHFHNFYYKVFTF